MVRPIGRVQVHHYDQKVDARDHGLSRRSPRDLDQRQVLRQVLFRLVRTPENARVESGENHSPRELRLGFLLPTCGAQKNGLFERDLGQTLCDPYASPVHQGIVPDHSASNLDVHSHLETPCKATVPAEDGH
jgi:hypothetical protein